MVTHSTLAKMCEECQIRPPERADHDIAEWNLLLASGLPGSEDLNIDDVLNLIEEWTDKVQHATSRNYGSFLRNPARYGHSLGKYYMAVLCSTLQRECGVKYNPERKLNPGDARDSHDRFIHGITHGNGGTCASLPVLYAAIGRRLGYPLKLVQGARHLFLRWDESDSTSCLYRDIFNIEATSPEGFVSPPDEYYRHFPFRHPDPHVDPKQYLRSLNFEEELAIFLCVRSIVLMDNGKFVQAIQPAAWARKLVPQDYSIQVHLELTILFALNLLGEKPKWMDEEPVIREDGAAWSRYWWPRSLPGDQKELLPAARLPHDILHRILPKNGSPGKVGDLADALYERVYHYADFECCKRAVQAAQSERATESASYHNQVRLARQREMFISPKPKRPRNVMPGLPKPPFPAMPQMPGPQHYSDDLDEDEMEYLEAYGGIPGGQHIPPGFGPARPRLSREEADRRFAMRHGIYPVHHNGSLFEHMGTPNHRLGDPASAKALPILKESSDVL